MQGALMLFLYVKEETGHRRTFCITISSKPSRIPGSFQNSVHLAHHNKYSPIYDISAADDHTDIHARKFLGYGFGVYGREFLSSSSCIYIYGVFAGGIYAVIYIHKLLAYRVRGSEIPTASVFLPIYYASATNNHVGVLHRQIKMHSALIIFLFEYVSNT